ncbi:Cortical protein marker for cell polarity [Phycisphaerae bacterium RAS1]|nr:Cortical protein marker for cell polarity [Phycisphaerae bacterium RAS1]
MPHPQLGIGPGAPHAPPYDAEVAVGLAANNWLDDDTFTLAEFAKGNAVMLTLMTVPVGGGSGAVGRTPDSLNGLMIPNTIFPIGFSIESLVGGQPFSPAFVISVPALDTNLDPPFPNIDGHSHSPVFAFDSAEFANAGAAVIGPHEYRVQARDQLGHGWDIVATFSVAAEPGVTCTYGWSRRFGVPGFGNQGGGSPQALAFQTWDDGNGPALYIGGTFVDTGGNLGGPNTIHSIARWDGEAFSALTNGTTNGQVNALTLFDDDGPGPRGTALYAAGTFTQIAGFSATRIARWDGAAWEALSTGIGASSVSALEVFDEDGAGPNPPRLFVGGSFGSAGGTPVNNIARWDGTTWTAVGGPTNGVNGSVLALKTYEGALVVAGNFSQAGGAPAQRLARWNGTSWSALASSGAGGSIRALEMYDDGTGPGLYVGGEFTGINGVSANNVARYKNGTFSALGSGVTGSNGVNALRAYDDGNGPALHVAGNFTTAGGQAANGIARWKLSGWTVIPGAGANSFASLRVFDDGKQREVYAGGPWSFIDDLRPYGVARWNGSRWASLGQGVSSENRVTLAACVHDDGGGAKLYVGGSGATIQYGGERTGAVAKWNGAEWATLFPGTTTGTVLNGLIETLESVTLPSGGGVTTELYAGGAFSMINGNPINGVARFDDGLNQWVAVGTGLVGLAGPVRDLKVFDDDGAGPIPPALYACGQNILNCLPACGTYAVARWDGATWVGVGSTSGGTMRRLIAFDADGAGPNGETLIAVGANAGGPMVRCVAGAAIPGCLNGGPATGFDADDAVLYDSGSGPQLYICGWFREPGLDTQIRRWNGASWDVIPFAPGFPLNRVMAMAVLDDGTGPKLYSASQVTNDGVFVRSWDGTTDAPVGGGVFSPFPFQIDEMIVHDDDGAGPKPASLWLIDAGRYVQGISTSGIAEWAALPPTITLHPDSQRVEHGSFVTLAADATASGPRLFRWTKDGAPLSDGPNLFGSATNTLLIFSAAYADEGEYRCVVSDACGQSCTVAAELDVFLIGDMNCDGNVDIIDINPFILALSDPAAYAAQYPTCEINNGDIRTYPKTGLSNRSVQPRCRKP